METQATHEYFFSLFLFHPQLAFHVRISQAKHIDAMIQSWLFVRRTLGIFIKAELYYFFSQGGYLIELLVS